MARQNEIDAEALRRGIFAVFPLIVILVFLMMLIWDSAYTVEPHERAVVFRFGKLSETAGPGLHFKIPFIDDVVHVDVQEVEFRLPFEEAPAGPRRTGSNEDESLMLTGDLNAAVVEWTVQWRVVEPAKFLMAIDANAVHPLVRNVARSVMQQMIGDYSIDEVLTSKRKEIGVAARDLLQEKLEEYGCGIEITGLQMQRVTPPASVKPSFDAVNASVQKRDQLINEANAERNRLIPTAEATKDKLIREAEGYADSRRAEAKGEVTSLLDRYRAYKEAPEATRQRLYLDAMEAILSASGEKVILDADLQGLLPLLQLNDPSTGPSNPPANRGR